MKQFIAICASIVLAVYIFNLVAGEGPTSLKNILGDVMEEQIEQQETYP